MPNMSKIKVGITGTIGSGKTTVTNYISQLYPTISADDIVNDLYKSRDFIILINKKILNIDSDILDKNLLAQEIFSNQDSLKKINEIIHPKVKEKIIDWLALQGGLCFVEVPLLYEAKFEDIFDKVIVVISEKKDIVNRLIKNRGYSESEALARISSQIPAKVKSDLADYVIYNDKSIIDLKEKTLEVISKIERMG
ncbi:MAG TPA: dephospho-CoA kinase [Erysipelotrichaceae bacterium]|nr:dephospho-CoA kinase [Erysipelotrichaceae bacterium]